MGKRTVAGDGVDYQFLRQILPRETARLLKGGGRLSILVLGGWLEDQSGYC